MKARPKHLDLRVIRLPLPAVVSILHRISGVGLFISIPFLIYMLEGSLSSAQSFEEYKFLISNPLVKFFMFIILFGYCYHLCAGIRFLLLDIHIGTELKVARNSAKIVIVCAIILSLIIGLSLW